ncbi:hypothetical protein LIA77_06571 [Sarocladium implicatum]|nr:hypothetical protein LIA77_06571 [Sarocladium implicatum]
MKASPSFIAIALLGISAPLGLAKDLYVTTEGSDGGDGTQRSPFGSLEKVQEATRALIANTEEDITIHFSNGVYALEAPLNLSSADSGQNGHTIIWKADGDDVLFSGGLKVTDWQKDDNGVYSASVPKGTKSRNLYVNGQASNYARRKIERKDFDYTESGMTWSDSQYDWLATTDLAGAEVRFINSFTDRYCPIESARENELVMVQEYWGNNIIGYDTVNNPFADFGVWVQNARELLHEGGQFYLDSDAGLVYYIPLNGEDMDTAETYLGIQEVLVSISGQYDDPAHDIAFEGINFAHTTWNAVSEFGYADQQTGAYIGENKTYPEFEASRPWWWQMPGAIQISAAKNIAFTGGSYTQLGAGGFGIGNDDNAHLSGTGLGAQKISITEGQFRQVMGNSIAGGGVQAQAHHPDSAAKINKEINISNNIFRNNSALFSSTVNVFVSYVQYSNITHNDIYQAPYSGICHGYGWGSNDAGGSSEYEKRGLYKYQPLYETPTTSQNNLILSNLVHSYGLSHTDLAALYTLGKSPSTFVNENFNFDSSFAGIYNDEGSNSMTFEYNDLFSSATWQNLNGVNTANNTYKHNWYLDGPSVDTNNQASSVSDTDAVGQRVAYRAGLEPSKRAGKPVTNPTDLADGFLGISCSDGTLTLTFWNFDDSTFSDVKFTASANDGSRLSDKSIPTEIEPDSWDQATYSVSGSGCPDFTAEVSYQNQRTGVAETLKGVKASPPSS